MAPHTPKPQFKHCDITMTKTHGLGSYQHVKPIPKGPENRTTKQSGTFLPKHYEPTRNTRFFTLTNVRNLNNKTPKQHDPRLTPQMHMSTNNMPMSSHIKTDNLCKIKAPTKHKHQYQPLPHSQSNSSSSHTATVDSPSKPSLTHKHTKYDSLINTIQNNGWKTPHYHYNRSRRGYTQTFHNQNYQPKNLKIKH